MPKPVQDRSKLRWTLETKERNQSVRAKRPIAKNNAGASDKSDADSDDQSQGSVTEDQDSSADSMEETSDLENDLPREGASKKTSKRKRRAVSPTHFGEMLQGLLGEEAEPSTKASKKPTPILSLAPSIRRSANSKALRAKAARMALEKRHERQERAHVRDVIGDWAPPGVLPGQPIDSESASMQEYMDQGGGKGYERRLRKVAQRGVVKLFNAIRAAQETSVDDVDKARALKQKSHQTNPLGSSERAVNELSKTNFLDLLRKDPRATSS
ncbi:hypothetical protein MYAM1_003874 [Malassezia yamatoensis]|uniref:Rrp15p-domain-containing protein n=1 Tax=Malassezia yamatoensis TaxID=253288 RepID=A0AAJ6CI80_9BASI|nr:hypothetical protein MYAM1_003874 [Malassezia yamatoensis]